MKNDFHEIWWIYSAEKTEWGGLRIAHFRRAANSDELIVFIQGELPNRIGPRIWSDIRHREKWHKIKQIPIPTANMIREGMKNDLNRV